MTDWKQHYKDHLGSLHDAAMAIKSGDCVWMGQTSEIPYPMLDEMHTHMDDYHDVMLMWNCCSCPFDLLFDPESKKHFRLVSFFCLPLERISGEMGIFEFHGCNFDFFDKAPDVYNCNTLAVHVCPPDEDGYCNVGAYGVGTTKMFASRPETTKKIGIIDKTGQCPARGDRSITCVHITDFDFIAECDTEMMEVPAPGATKYDKAIAEHIGPYLRDHDKIEIGWGGLGEEILNNLRGKGTFEVFSEVACDSTLPLLREGVITKITAAAPGACSSEFFAATKDDPRVSFIPMMQAIHPFAIAKLENIVAINSTFMCDLLGQCCSEAQGLMPYSGAGGSFAYIYGSTQAKGGRSFICLRSTFVDGAGVTHTNIVAWLPEGCIVTTPKNLVMYIVSEYGVADVYLRTLKDRIRALIKIAHPDFRAELQEKICTTPLISEEDFKS